MKTDNNQLEEIRHKEALQRYVTNYILKRKKNKLEQAKLDETARYVIYARKSTDDQTRQKKSLYDQIKLCKEFAKRNNLFVADVLREKKSAKTSGKRPKFNLMIEKIKEGKEYNSILAWHPDRLARNMKESGEIMDLLDKGVIWDLKFESYYFYNDPAGKMTLSMLFAMAKEFSDKLSVDTKRGIESIVSDGKYSGRHKRGYNVNKDGYFRVDKDTFYIYQDAWKRYAQGKISQSEIVKDLKNKGIDITEKQLSYFFMNPFYAGIHCHGDNPIDMKLIDPHFESMVTPQEFIAVQRENRANPTGWHRTEEFRPFNSLIVCDDCKSFMTSGISKGKGGRYLSISCGNTKCRLHRKQNGIKPIVNAIRGTPIVNLAIKIVKESLELDQKTYEKFKAKYIESKGLLITDKTESIKTLKIQISKMNSKSDLISKKILDIDIKTVQDKLSTELKYILEDIREKKDELRKLELDKSELETVIDLDFPDYNDFVNFFENYITTIVNTENTYLIDQLVKLVCVNIIVKDKNIVSYKLCEPFETHKTLKFLSGVEDGT